MSAIVQLTDTWLDRSGEILYCAILLLTADYQARQFAVGKTIPHFWWAAANGILIAGAWLVRDKDYWLAVALILERIWLFNPSLNLMRGKQFFYIGQTSSGSWIDRHINSSIYAVAFGVAMALFIFIQFHL